MPFEFGDVVLVRFPFTSQTAYNSLGRKSGCLRTILMSFRGPQALTDFGESLEPVS